MKLLLGNNRSHGSLPGRNVYEGEDPGNAIHCLTKVELSLAWLIWISIFINPNISLTFNKTLSKNYKCKNKRKLISKIYYFFLWDTFLIHFPYKTRIIDSILFKRLILRDYVSVLPEDSFIEKRMTGVFTFIICF
jgi:hypothetical protein